ncbi:MAG: amino acid-binding ACT domain-containing protein [Opitutus sp.]
MQTHRVRRLAVTAAMFTPNSVNHFPPFAESRPGSLPDMGEALGRAGVSVEGGGAFVVNGNGIAHFLLADGARARVAWELEGIHVIAVREVLVQKLQQSVPGQLGKLSRLLANAGVNIEVLSQRSCQSNHSRS